MLFSRVVLCLSLLVFVAAGVVIVAVLFPEMDGISTRFAVAPGSRVGEEDGAAAKNASRRDGPVARAQPFERGGLSGAGDQPQDTPCPVDRGKGEGHPPPSLVKTGDGDLRINDLERRIAR